MRKGTYAAEVRSVDANAAEVAISFNITAMDERALDYRQVHEVEFRLPKECAADLFARLQRAFRRG